jgi:hypothetical protein
MSRRQIHPFTNRKTRYFCLKDNCNALFFTEDDFATHETFCHSEHPLGGVNCVEKEQTDNKTSRGKVEKVVTHLEIEREPSTEDEVYRTMVMMSSEFFDEFLRKVRVFEFGGERRVDGEAAESI